MSTAASQSNQTLLVSILTLVIAVCFREQINRIDNRHLYLSLVGAMSFGFVSGILKAILSRMTVPEDFLVTYLNLWLAPAICDIMMFCLFTYHTSYRAMILIWHDGRRPPWAVAGVIALVELSINLAATVVIQTNLLKYFTLVRDATTQRITTALIVYVSLVDSGFFVATQLRIVSVMSKVTNVEMTHAHYVDAALRSVCFSGAVFLYFTTLNGAFFDPSEGYCFLATSPALIQIVLLTDSDRIRKLVHGLRGEPVARTGSDGLSQAGGGAGTTTATTTQLKDRGMHAFRSTGTFQEKGGAAAAAGERSGLVGVV